MSKDELDQILREERVCRVATISADGSPHVSPLWFVWDGSALWLNSVVKSQRWTDIERDPTVSVLVDSGIAYDELRGAELKGRLEQIGDVPRTDRPDPELLAAERLFGQKYRPDGSFRPDGRHAWLRLVPAAFVSWDFRKLAAL